MLANLWVSVGTFKYSSWEKLGFIALNLADLILTLYANYMGFTEINPLMRGLLGSPLQLIVTKCAIPIAFAWLIPGRLLLPAILLLSFVVGWNVKELVVFLI
jgi:hypothetical protein